MKNIIINILHKFAQNILYIGILYITTIISFSFIYCKLPKESFNVELNLAKSIYFSIVTITTLGYGDILPESSLAMIVVACEVIFGVIILGLFLNSLSKKIEERINLDRKALESLQSLQSAKIFYNHLSICINDYKRCCYFLTTPIEKRSIRPEYSDTFCFSDLKNIFNNVHFSYKQVITESIINTYFRFEEDLVLKLKEFSNNFSSDNFDSVNRCIGMFLIEYEKSNVKIAILDSQDINYGADDARSVDIQQIKAFSGEPSSIKDGTVLTKYRILFYTIKEKMKLIKQIEDAYANIISQS